MGKKLIITEKPSVARDFASILHVSGKQNGYIENEEYVITWCVGHLVGLVYPEDYDIRYKKWKLEDLPFLPETYKYDIIKSVKEQYYTVHKMLQREDIDRVYWAGDAGKEGQTIEENIRNFGGVRKGMEEVRVWIDSQTEEEILRGIREAKPMSEYANLGKSGIMRTIEDYAMGINFSRAMSVKYGKLLNDTAGTRSYTAIAVGRVMTCVLGMVVDREREIRNFKETPFYRVVGNFTDANVDAEWKAVEGSDYFQSPKLYKENGFKEEKDAQALIDQLQGKPARVLEIEKSTSRKKAPLLFNLAELQAECAKRFKISPDETLQAAQDLYEKKLTTYPRTDARVLSSAVAKEIYKNIGKLKNYEPVEKFVTNIMDNKLYSGIARTQYTDDSKITDHYAIIPTGQVSELKSLTGLQKSVYDLIVRRFLSIFYPPAEYENVKLTIGVEKEKFFASGKVLKKPGYLEIANPSVMKNGEAVSERISDGNNQNFTQKTNNSSNTGITGNGYNYLNGNNQPTQFTENGEEQTANPQVLLALADTLKKGEEVPVNGYSIRCGKTSPPKRYTSGSMVLAMENAGQLIEEEELREQLRSTGIGTSATRAEIIAKLVRIHYLNLNKKTQILTPENLGEMVYEVVNMTVPALLNPKMTASWEKGLDGITRGTVDYAEYRRKLEDYIRRETLKMIGQDILQPLQEKINDFSGKKGTAVRKKIGAKCPLCGKGDIITTPFGYGCSEYKADKSGCNFTIGEICGLHMEEADVLQLLTEGHTRPISGFKSKAGKKFSTCLKLTRNEKNIPQISFDFDSVPDEVVEGVACPMCGGKIIKTSYGFACTNHKAGEENSCKFTIGQICGKSLTAKDLQKLLTEGRTETIRGFKSKAGKKFDGCLAMKKEENGSISIVFDFEHAEDDILEDVKCPMCGGAIKKTSFGYGCVNYKGDDPESCRFSIGKIAGKNLAASHVKQLLQKGETETIRGFKSKSGKKFDGKLVLSRDENGKVTGLKFSFDDLAPNILKDVSCPRCGGKIQITPFGYTCENNHRDDPESCKFFIGQIASVKLTKEQVTELLTKGKTGVISGFVAKTGMKFDAPLKLNDRKEIVFDFPERPKPEESAIPCPACGKNLKKGKWQYECECGYKLWHTVAKVPLTEETILELLKTGKTRKKIKGFTSKAGNVFDTCLKLEDGRILFDFENPGEEDTPETETQKKQGAQDTAHASQTDAVTAFARADEADSVNESVRDSEPDSANAFVRGSEADAAHAPAHASESADNASEPADSQTSSSQDYFFNSGDDWFAMYESMVPEEQDTDVSDNMLAQLHSEMD